MVYIKWNYLGCFLAFLCPYQWCQSTNNLPLYGFSWEVRGSVGVSNASLASGVTSRKYCYRGNSQWEALLPYTMEIIKHGSLCHGSFRLHEPFAILGFALGFFSLLPSCKAQLFFPSSCLRWEGTWISGPVLLGLPQGTKLKRERIIMSPIKREAEEGWQVQVCRLRWNHIFMH